MGTRSLSRHLLLAQDGHRATRSGGLRRGGGDVCHTYRPVRERGRMSHRYGTRKRGRAQMAAVCRTRRRGVPGGGQSRGRADAGGGPERGGGSGGAAGPGPPAQRPRSKEGSIASRPHTRPPLPGPPRAPPRPPRPRRQARAAAAAQQRESCLTGRGCRSPLRRATHLSSAITMASNGS